METLYAAKYNVYWYLSFAAPAAIMLFATLWHRKWVLILGILVSLSLAVPLRMASVRVRWDRQAEIARTPEELFAVQARDLPPMVEVAILSPSQALLSTALWSAIGWIGWARVRAVVRKTGLCKEMPLGPIQPPKSGMVRVFARYTPGILLFLVWLTYLSCVGWQRNNLMTADPTADTGSSLFYGMVVVYGFGLAVTATIMLLCIWFACLRATKPKSEATR
jgi:hypothetical protein